MNMRRIAVCAGVAIVAAAGAVLLTRRDVTPVAGAASGGGEKGKVDFALTRRDAASPKVAQTNAAPIKVRKPSENGWAEALGPNRLAAAEAMLKRQKPERATTEAEEALVTAAHEIASAEDVAKARAFAAKHMQAEHPKVREAAVFALANCGTSCLAELTPFLADPDEGVRLEAQSAWQSELAQLTDRQLKVDAIVAVMCVLNDEQALEPIVQQLVGLDRQTLAEIVKVVAAEGTEAGKAQAIRLCESHGEE